MIAFIDDHRAVYGVARCTVERLMQEIQLQGAVRGKVKRTTVSDKAQPCPLDHVNRDFQPARPNALWLSDFTYVATWHGFAYVAFVIDAFARRIVGWRASHSAETGFVLDALEQALHARQPVSNSQLVHHGDRGVQYVSIKYTERLQDAGIQPLVGSVGDSYDNALAETVIGLYKTEVIRWLGPWRNLEALELTTVEWIDWLNNRRLLEPIGHIPPDPLGVQGGFGDTDEYNILGKAGYTFGPDRAQRVEVSVNHFDIEQDSDFTFSQSQGNAATGQKTPAVRGSINVKNPGNENTKISAAYEHGDIAGTSLEVQGYYNDSTATFGKFPGFNQTEVVSEKFGLRSTAETPIELQGLPVTAIYGVDVLRDETVQRAIDGPTTVPLMEQIAAAGFAEVEVPVRSWGNVRAGVRYERIGVDVSDVVNRNGIAVNSGTLTFNEALFNVSGVTFLTDRVELFGRFSQGFTVGDIGRAIRDGNATDAEQLESEAQKVNNYEIGLRGRTKRLQGSLAGFLSTSDNGTTFDQNLNIATTPERIWGVEASAEATPVQPLTVGGTFTWQQGIVDLDDDGDFDEDLPSTRVPPVKITGHIDYAPTDWLNGRIQGLYSGERDPDSTQFGGNDVDDYVLFDLRLSADTGYGELHLGVENLSNNDYFPVVSQAGSGALPSTTGPGRRATLTYSVQW